MKKLILGFALTLFLGSYVSAGNPPQDKTKAPQKKECCAKATADKKSCCKEMTADKAAGKCCKAKSTVATTK
jgi:hypothetical protein